MEPLNKGQVGKRCFVLYREVSFIQRLKCTGIIGMWTSRFVLKRCPLSEVPLYKHVLVDIFIIDFHFGTGQIFTK